MPLPPWKEWMYQELADIYYKQGLTPIIAHMDRYVAPWRTYRIPERLADLPVLVQVNGSFFLNKKTRRMALRLLQREMIHLLGSDCHNLQHRRPNLEEAGKVILQYLGEEVVQQLQQYEQHVLEGNL